MNGLQKSTYKSINLTISVGKGSLENGIEAENNKNFKRRMKKMKIKGPYAALIVL